MERMKPSLHDFPDEVLLCIFKNLKPKDLLCTISLLNNRFRRISSDPALWKNVTINTGSWTWEMITQFKLIRPQISSFKIRNNQTGLAYFQIETNPRLETLHLEYIGNVIK